MESLGKYLFWVDTRANKVQIRQSVEEIYQVKVKDVNTAVMPGKLRRVRHVAGKSPDWKKAIVTLEKGQRIEIK
jgi:large subunit ribosomal protein L23